MFSQALQHMRNNIDMTMKNLTLNQRVGFYTISAIVVASTSWFLFDILWNVQCNRVLDSVVHDTCALYAEGRIAGSLCETLCVTKSFEKQQCYKWTGGKKAMLIKIGADLMVLKSPNNASIWLKKIPKHDTLFNEIRTKITSLVGPHNVTEDKDAFKLLWTGDHQYEILIENKHKNTAHNKEREAIYRSLWSLVTQDEYIFMRFFSDNSHIPKIYGTCGDVYATEFAPNVHNSHLLPWEVRVELAVEFLKFAKSFDEIYEKNHMHFCDVKGVNFGRSGDGMIKAIDTDMIRTERELIEMFKNVTSCSHDADCTYFDCYGICNQTTKKCEPKVVNDSFEKICRKVFGSGNGFDRSTGLRLFSFSSTHVSATQHPELSRALEKCKEITQDASNKFQQLNKELYRMLENGMM